MGRRTSRSTRYRPLLPQNHDPRWLPDPIPATFYARGEAPPWVAWASAVRGMSPRTALAAGGVALAAVVLIGVVAALARHPATAAPQLAQVPGSTARPGASPPGQSTPLAAIPTPTDTPTPTPTPTPRTSPTPSATPVTLTPARLQARRGRSVTLTAQTAPRISCTISVGYSPAPAPPLAAVVTDNSGSASWRWTIGAQVAPGIYPIQVTCGGATAGATITVSPGG